MSTIPPKSDARYRLKAMSFALVLFWPAAEAGAQYHVSAYADSPGYTQIMSADYAAAGEAIPNYSPLTPSFALSTNRCVSEIMADSLASALESCNRALRKMPNYLMPLGAASIRDRNATRSDLLSNRGVVLALTGQWAEAESDFELAAKLDPENTNAEKNLTFLRSSRLTQR